MKECKTVSKEKLISIMDEFSMIYDIVRIVEPENTSVMKYEEDHLVKSQMDPCFSVWNKTERCDNCVSLRACVEKRRVTKFEFRDEEIYSVVSMPFLVQDEDGDHVVALELVNHVADDLVLQAKGEGEAVEQVEKINKKVYEDSLTGVYNRRYYDENRYVYQELQVLPKSVGYLVIDVNKFKHVNDTFGHAHGDDLLIQVADAIRKSVREADSVMRVGGDEFLVVMRNCSKVMVEKRVGVIKRAVNQISMEWMGEFKASVAIGISYTEKFDGTKEMSHKLFKKADEKMYENKTMPVEEKKQMLLVDDIKVGREVLKSHFEDDFQILEACDGVQALEILKKYPIEIVITDIYMPNMDGITLTRTIRNTPEIGNVVIFVITDRGEENEIRALEAGADDFINKPFNPELLNHRIKGVLSQNTVFNRISQYQLSFNQNQIPFATVRITENEIVYEYVNDAFIQLMNGTPQEFLSGRKHLHFKGFPQFVKEVCRTHKRNRMTVHDEETGNYYDVVAYAQDNGFCSFIILRNDALRMMDVAEVRYRKEFDDLATVNPNTMGALFINLKTDQCIKGYGGSKYMEKLTYPIPYQNLIENLVSYAPSEEVKNKFLDLTDKAKLLKAYSAGKKNFGIEIPCKMFNGTVKWLGAYVKLTRNAETNEIIEILYCIDIHNRKLSELVVENVSSKSFDMLICIDRISMTAQIYQRNGVTAWSDRLALDDVIEVIEKSLNENYYGEDKEKFIEENNLYRIIDIMDTEDYYEVDFDLMDNGERRRKKVDFYWLDSSRTILGFTRTDVTDIVQKMQEINSKLEETNEELIKAGNAKMEFLSRMSHDIRTPMNTIIGLTSLAVDDIHNPDKMREYIDKINSSSKFLLGLVNDVLDMSRIDRGEMKLHVEAYRYEEFFAGLHMMFDPLCKQNSQTLVLRKPESEICVMVDKIRLNQIFVNIISNAVKYTPNGGTISFFMENINLGNDGISADYIVEDNGIGMSKEFQKQMFSEFSQEQKHMDKKVQGSGLGLAITKKLVEMMNGTISVESKENEGTRITIHLSLRLASEKPVSENYSEWDEKERILKGKNILLVEDHPLNQEIAKQLLIKKGMTVFCADNGKEAVEKFNSSTPGFFQAIVMDIRMPIMDGLEATRTIRSMKREDASGIPIIAMTGNAYEEDMKEALDAGMDAHLAKPIEPALLYQKITELLMAEN